MTENIDKKEKDLSLFDAVVIFGILIAFLLGIGSDWSIFSSDYYFFTKSRITEMENTFGITVTDDIKLKKYHELSWTSFDYQLEIRNIDSPESFLKNNVNGKNIEKSKFKDYKYFYDWENNSVSIEFYELDNNTYKAILYKHD